MLSTWLYYWSRRFRYDYNLSTFLPCLWKLTVHAGSNNKVSCLYLDFTLLWLVLRKISSKLTSTRTTSWNSSKFFIMVSLWKENYLIWNWKFSRSCVEVRLNSLSTLFFRIYWVRNYYCLIHIEWRAILSIFRRYDQGNLELYFRFCIMTLQENSLQNIQLWVVIMPG